MDWISGNRRERFGSRLWVLEQWATFDLSHKNKNYFIQFKFILYILKCDQHVSQMGTHTPRPSGTGCQDSGILPPMFPDDVSRVSGYTETSPECPVVKNQRMLPVSWSHTSNGNIARTASYGVSGLYAYIVADQSIHTRQQEQIDHGDQTQADDIAKTTFEGSEDHETSKSINISEIGKNEYRGSEPAFTLRESIKPFRENPSSSPERDSNLSFPVLGSLSQHEISALINYAIKLGATLNTNA
uniref:Uncharacterized protein n=1 Tax=Timema poppense TaxID=170557 RepID=A0A7R9DBX0_TIMPO|nr:unnamed protein product [Timema poppensis]